MNHHVHQNNRRICRDLTAKRKISQSYEAEGHYGGQREVSGAFRVRCLSFLCFLKHLNNMNKILLFDFAKWIVLMANNRLNVTVVLKPVLRGTVTPRLHRMRLVQRDTTTSLFLMCLLYCGMPCQHRKFCTEPVHACKSTLAQQQQKSNYLILTIFVDGHQI